MATFYYHYTSRQFAQEIYCSGEINSPSSGINYISPDFYQSGAEAEKALSLQGKPIEVACAIPDYTLILALGHPIPLPTSVKPITHPTTGRIIKGGGYELEIRKPIPLNPVQFVNLISP